MSITTAYRKVGNGYTEIIVDVDPRGNPLLPPNTTVEPPPEQKEGFFLTIEGTGWTYIEIPTPPEPSFEELKGNLIHSFSKWKDAYLNGPYIYDSKVLDGDEVSRERIMGSVSAYTMYNKLPVAWVTYDKQLVTPVTNEWLSGLGNMSYTAFQTRFIEATLLEGMIHSLSNKEEVERFVLPEISTVEICFRYIEQGVTNSYDIGDGVGKEGILPPIITIPESVEPPPTPLEPIPEEEEKENPEVPVEE